MMQRHGASAPGSLQVYADDAGRHRLFGVCQLDVLLSFASVCPRCVSPPILLPTVPLGRRELCEHLIASHHKLAELGGPSADVFRRIACQLTRELADLSS